MIEYIEIVKLDKMAGTQHRMLNDEVVLKYAELIKEGEEFPEIQVVDVEGRLVVVDGFHRIAAYEENDMDMISADIIPGTMKDAIWLSLGTNRHGMPATANEIERKVRIALKDKAWCIKSSREIGKHIGCSHEYVRQIKNRIDEEDKPQVSTVDIPEDKELNTEQTDIGSELSEVFLMRGMMDKLAGKIDSLVADIDRIKDEDGTECLNTYDIQKNLASAKKLILAAKPYKECPVCSELNRATCEVCSGNGWLTEKQYQLTIKM